MEFGFGGELPDEHVFLDRVRPLVESAFKFISWAIITATLGVGAEITDSRWLWAIYIVASLLLIFFVQGFINWLFAMKFPKWKSSRRSSALSKPSPSWVKKVRSYSTTVVALVIWFIVQTATMQTVERVVGAIANFQKSAR